MKNKKLIIIAILIIMLIPARIILKDGTYQNTALSYMILLDKKFKYMKMMMLIY